jgi:hypothetical protein
MNSMVLSSMAAPRQLTAWQVRSTSYSNDLHRITATSSLSTFFLAYKLARKRKLIMAGNPSERDGCYGQPTAPLDILKLKFVGVRFVRNKHRRSSNPFRLKVTA